jgi:hypothetical protein
MTPEHSGIPAPGDAEGTPRLAVTRRALVLGLVLAAGLAYLTPYNDYYVGATLVAGNYLPVGAFFLLTVLCLVVNGLSRLLRRAAAFKPAELIAIWCMIATASSIPASGLMRFLIPHIIAPSYYATPENQWEKNLLIHLPDELRIKDEDAVQGFFEPSRHGGVPWGLWVPPLVSYGVYVIALYVSFFCLSTLLRRQWVEHERFTFPLVQLPVEMAASPRAGRRLGPIWYDRGLWLSVLVLTAVHTANGLRLFYPAIPRINLYDHPVNWFTGRPWMVLNGLRYPVYPLVVGLGYLLKSEVLFSLWFFYLFFQGERVVASALGLSPAATYIGYGWPAFGSQQAAGMALGLVLWMVWKSRHYLREIVRKIFVTERRLDDREEGLPLQWAALGWLASSAVMYVWLVHFGHDFGTAFATVLFGTVAYVVLSWMVAEGGVPFLQSPWSGAEMAARLFGFRSFSPRGMLVSNQIESITMLDLREFTLPHLMNTQKFTDAVRLSRRGMLAAVAAAMAVTLLLAGEESIRLPYQHGAATMYDTWAYRYSPQRPLIYLSAQLIQPTPASLTAWANLLAGGLGCWALMSLQAYVAGFPLHPAGFIFAPGYPLSCFWFSFLVAWVLKSVILRYGGLQVYRRLRPLFLGLVLGDAMNGAIWIAVGLVTRRAYVVLPG